MLEEEALELWKLAIGQGNARNHVSAIRLAVEIYERKGMHDDAFQSLKLVSDQGCLLSRQQLADKHAAGLGTTRDEAEALRLRELLAQDFIVHGNSWSNRKKEK